MAFVKNWNMYPNVQRITFLLVQKIRSMHDIELFTIWVCLSIICLFPADDEEIDSWPAELVITTEEIGSSSFMLLRSASNFTH